MKPTQEIKKISNRVKKHKNKKFKKLAATKNEKTLNATKTQLDANHNNNEKNENNNKWKVNNKQKQEKGEVDRNLTDEQKNKWNNKKRKHEEVDTSLSQTTVKKRVRFSQTLSSHENESNSKISKFKAKNFGNKKMQNKNKAKNEEDEANARKKHKRRRDKKKNKPNEGQDNERKTNGEKHGDHELTKHANIILNELNADDCKEAKRKETLNKFVKLINDNIKVIVNDSETAGVIETIAKALKDNDLNLILNDIKESMMEMTKSKSAKSIVLKMLQHSNELTRIKIIESFYGHVKQMMRHPEASQVIEDAFNEYAKVKERNKLAQEYYGNDFVHFKDEKTFHLRQVLEKLTPDKRELVLSQMKEEFIKFKEKELLNHSFVHYLLREYFTAAGDEDKHELVELMADVIVNILHTKDGSRVGMHCIWNANAKNRKAILKSFKPHVAKIAKEENGHLVLLAAFDCVDDTVLIEKCIINELVSPTEALSIAKNRYGRKVFEYLLSPRDTKYFHPDVINLLTPGDNNPYSKKSKDIRVRELRATASPHLLKLAEEHVKELLSDGPTALLVFDIITMSCTENTPALRAFAKLISDEGEYHEPNGDSFHIIERPNTNFTIKKLLMFEKRQKQQQEEKLLGFAKILAETVPKHILKTWFECNRGAFTLLDMLELNIPEVTNIIKGALKDMHKKLAQKSYKGALLLLQKLNS